MTQGMAVDSKMKAKIFEIFQSVQGEGKYAGTRQVFVRFFECHMHCRWCDTPNSIGDTQRDFKEMTLEEVMGEIMSFKDSCHSVSLTGGEPLLQKDFLKELLAEMKKKKWLSYLETSGVLYQELEGVIDGVDMVAMDFKLPSSTKCQPFWREHKEFLKIAQKKDVFVKAVITSDTLKEDIEKAIELIVQLDPQLFFILQPNYFEIHNGAVKKCLEFQEECLKYLKNVRVMPQMHKMMKLK